MNTLATLLTISLLFLGCNKGSMDRNTVVGLWKLSSTAIIFGDSLYESPTSARSYLEFTVYGKVIFDTENMDNYRSTNAYTYTITSDSTLEIVTTGNTIGRFSYTIQSNTLTLSGGCIEPCISRYKAVSNK